MGLTTTKNGLPNNNNNNNNNNNASSPTYQHAPYLRLPTVTVATAPPPRNFPYFIVEFDAQHIIIKSATPGVFKIKRNLDKWLVPGEGVYFNETFDEFTAYFSSASAIATVRNFINQKPGLLAHSIYVLDNLPQHKPIATFNVNHLEASAPPPEYAPPPRVLGDGIDLEEFFDCSATGAQITNAFNDTLPRSNNNSPEAVAKFHDNITTNEKKLDYILKHPGLGKNNTEIKEARDAINKHIETMCYECPLSRVIMNNPVILPYSGKSIDEASISMCKKDEVYRDLYADNKEFILPLTINRDLANGITEYLNAKLKELESVKLSNNNTFS